MVADWDNDSDTLWPDVLSYCDGDIGKCHVFRRPQYEAPLLLFHYRRQCITLILASRASSKLVPNRVWMNTKNYGIALLWPADRLVYLVLRSAVGEAAPTSQSSLHGALTECCRGGGPNIAVLTARRSDRVLSGSMPQHRSTHCTALWPSAVGEAAPTSQYSLHGALTECCRGVCPNNAVLTARRSDGMLYFIYLYTLSWWRFCRLRGQWERNHWITSITW